MFRASEAIRLPLATAATASVKIFLHTLDYRRHGSVLVVMETNSNTTSRTAAIDRLLAGLAGEIDAAMDAALSLDRQQRVGEIFQRCVAASALLTASRTLLARSE